jgi:hypothetical protein
MFSKLATRTTQYNQLTALSTKAFRASAVAGASNKKPSIGDAVTILQSKVSQINQVVSTPSLSKGLHNQSYS